MTRDFLTLAEALGIGKGAVAALVGGGGKTSTMLRLCAETAKEGCRVLATTTARMKMEELNDMRDVLLWDERDATGETWSRCQERSGGLSHDWVDQALSGEPADSRLPVTFLGRSVMRDKLVGLPAEHLGGLLSRLTWDVAFVEADGSRGRSVKGHRLGEPIVPLCSTHCVIVVGADGIEGAVNEEHCHRPEVIQDLLGLDWGERLSPGHVVDLVCHPRGILSKIPGDMDVTLYINKAPIGGEPGAAHEMAQLLMSRCGQRVQRVAIGDNRQGGIVEAYVFENASRGD